MVGGPSGGYGSCGSGVNRKQLYDQEGRLQRRGVGDRRRSTGARRHATGGDQSRRDDPREHCRGEAYTKARQAHGESELLDALVAAPPAADPGQLRSSGDIAKLSNDSILGALQILEQKASPEEVEAYKMFVTAVAHAAANAHREGGFLGVGGTHVSDEEQQALDELAAKLKPSS